MAALPRYLPPNLPSGVVQRGWDIGRQLPALEEQLLHASEPTLVHGDYRAENLLFGPAKDEEEIAVLRWREAPALLESYAMLAGLDGAATYRSYALACCTAISQCVLSAADLSRGTSRQQSLAQALARRVLAALADVRLPL